MKPGKLKSLQKLILAGCYILLFCTPATFGAKEESSKVSLSLKEYEELFRAARIAEMERRLLDQNALQDAEYQRKITDIDRVQAKITESERQQNLLFPKNFQVLHHNASGFLNIMNDKSLESQDEVATFIFELTLRTIRSEWTKIPIFNISSLVANDFQLLWKDDSMVEFEDIDLISNSDTMLIIRDDQQVLMTNRSCLFRLSFNAFTRSSKSRNLNSVGFTNMLYPLSDLNLRFRSERLEFVKDFTLEPLSSVVRVKQSGNVTILHGTLPLNTNTFKVRWLELDEQSLPSVDASVTDKSKSAEDGQVSVRHQAIHIIGDDGIIRSSHTLEFIAASGMPSTLHDVEFKIHGKKLRVISLAGHGLERWFVQDQNRTSSMQVVRASLKKSQVHSVVTLQLLTELDYHHLEAKNIELPRIESLNSLRQTGHVAVVKDANVEVHESKKSGISSCDSSDLPSQLRLSLDRPAILAYKYLAPDYSISLHVQEHQAIETLEATCDRAHYKVVVTDTHTFHSLILIVQSTKMQYLEVQGLPSSASMFTVAVNSIASRPVKGVEGGNSIHIPLLVGSNPDCTAGSGVCRTSIEIDFVSKHDGFNITGELDLSPPQLTLPISLLSIHVRLPTDFSYKFFGDFGDSPSEKLKYRIPSALSYQTGKRVVTSEYEFSTIDDFWPEDTNEGGSVKMVAPQIGQSFYFHRILVVERMLKLHATYHEPMKIEGKSIFSKFLFG